MLVETLSECSRSRLADAARTIDLIAGNTYSIAMEYFESVAIAVAELRWESPSTPKQLIPQAALSLPVKAGSANPRNGATGVKHTPVLKWEQEIMPFHTRGTSARMKKP